MAQMLTGNLIAELRWPLRPLLHRGARGSWLSIIGAWLLIKVMPTRWLVSCRLEVKPK